MISAAEFFPVYSLRQNQLAEAEDIARRHGSSGSLYVDSEDVSRSLLGLFGWIEEMSERDISELYGIESGDTFRATETARWLLRAMGDIAKYARMPDVRDELEALRIRVDVWGAAGADTLGLHSTRGQGTRPGTVCCRRPEPRRRDGHAPGQDMRRMPRGPSHRAAHKVGTVKRWPTRTYIWRWAPLEWRWPLRPYTSRFRP